MRLRRLSALPILLILLTACAVRKAPQIDSETQWRLNTASQLQQLESDYRMMFKDVGDAQRQGILTADNVIALNAVGNRLKPAIEDANRLFKAYAASPATDKKAQVISAILVAEQILLELSTKKAQMIPGGK